MTTAIVFNPHAGRGRGREAAERARALLETKGDRDVRVLETWDARGAEPVLREVANDIERAVVVGGDGSLHQAVRGLGEHLERVRVAILPSGNANVVARDLRIPLDLEGALAVLAADETRVLDLGLFEGEPFVALAGLGFDARAVRALDALRETRLGRWLYRLSGDAAYALSGARALMSAAPRFRVTVDGRVIERDAVALVVSSVETYAKGWKMTPGAQPDDGLLDLQVRHRGGPLSFTRHLLAAVRHRPCAATISTHLTGVEVEVMADEPLPVQIDGEFVGERKTMRFTIQPGAWRLVAPAKGSLDG